MRYSKVCLGLWSQFSTLIGQLGRVPLFGTQPWRYIRSWLFSSAFTVLWRALTASWRENRGESSSFSGFFGPHKTAFRPFDPAQLQNESRPHRPNSFKPLPPQPWQPQRISASSHRAARCPSKRTRHAPRGTNASPTVLRRMHFTARTSTHSLTLACSWMVTSQLRFGVPEKTCVVYASSSTEIYSRAQGRGLVDAKGSGASSISVIPPEAAGVGKKYTTQHPEYFQACRNQKHLTRFPNRKKSTTAVSRLL